MRDRVVRGRMRWALPVAAVAMACGCGPGDDTSPRQPATAGAARPEPVGAGVEWMFYPVAQYYAARQSHGVTRYDIHAVHDIRLPAPQ